MIATKSRRSNQIKRSTTPENQEFGIGAGETLQPSGDVGLAFSPDGNLAVKFGAVGSGAKEKKTMNNIDKILTVANNFYNQAARHVVKKSVWRTTIFGSKSSQAKL